MRTSPSRIAAVFTRIDSISLAARPHAYTVKRDEDSWLIDGVTPLPDVEHALDVEMLSPEGQYETVGGLVMHQLRRVPRKGDRVESSGFSFDVMSVEGFRINQLLVTRLPRAAGGAAETPPVRHTTSAS